MAAEERFAARWLELREEVDHRSRPEGLLAPLVEEWRRRGWRRVVDLGSGTGSNLRYLAPRLPGEQRWVLVDHDPALLARVRVPEGVELPEQVEGDLAGEGLARLSSAHLVTASALLDLVSEGWMRLLLEGCREAGAGVLLALSYDGVVGWVPRSASPTEALGKAELPGAADDRILNAVNRHQGRDKGLGPALGPRAPEVAESLLREAGYRVWRTPSPWVLGPEDGEVADSLLRGWAQAVREEAPELAPRLDSWRRERMGWVTRGERRLVVGHQDLLALPEG